MYNKVLVPLDGSKRAESALSLALQLMKNSDGEIILLNIPMPTQVLAPASSPFDTYHLAMSYEIARERGKKYLDEMINAHAESGQKFRPILQEGDPASVIIDTAEAEAVELVVMTTHGYSGPTRWIMGSVSERVLRGVSCPILVNRPQTSLTHMLVTLDGSQLSEQIIEPASQMAQALGVDVTLLHIEETRRKDLEPFAEQEGISLDDAFKRFRAQWRDYLEEVVQRFQGVEVEIEVVPADDANTAESILDVAEAGQVGLIAMSTHGRTGLQRWVYGSVTEKILRSSEVALLVVRRRPRRLKANWPKFLRTFHP